ncbi:hypothetical protein OUZ56_012596 [Daphnia magna]|uniref:BEN domain-containing protein n=1 Tax=Daphnia magna TaxID=35525 RepID=A0ABQ9Z3H7_9CRUS|nr:hypothetical protein OUZ56_012596 [Daphnia magna]
MMLDKSILVLGGREASNVEDILILQYDEDFGDIIDVNHDVVFYHKQKDVVVKLRKNCPNEEMSTITSFSFNGREENDVASVFPEPSIIENLVNKGKDASSELHDVTDNHKSDCESSSSAKMQCSANTLNLENDVSDSRELLSYAVIDGVKHTAVLVKFDETDVDAVKINVLTHNELFDVFHTQSDGNYAACSCDSEYESTVCISGTDHGDAQSLNKSPRQKRKRFKTKRATLAKPPAISTSNTVNKSTKESNIGDNLVENCDFKFGLTSEAGTAAKNPPARSLVKMSKNIPSEEVILSLPNEGKEDFEIYPILATEIQKNVLTLHSNRFLFVCAKQLLNINKGSMISKGMYKRYAKMVVEKYPCLKDIDFEEEFLSVKMKIIKAVNNQRGNVKTKESRKLKVNDAHEPNQSQNLEFPVNVQESQLDIAASDIEKSFKERRLYVKTNHSLRTDQILTAIPFYLDFPKRYYLAEHNNQSAASTAVFFEGEKGTIGLLMAINRLCSTKKGTSSSAELFEIAQVNMRVEPSYKGINARALLFFDDHDYLQSMLIICGTARNFKNIPVTKSWQAVFKLLSVYYVFDGNYPALYGVLSVIERRCISQLLNTSITVDPKDSSSLKVFIRKFNAFMKNS